MPITFVVSTGRCGSTMLSRILHRHPDVLSISEFISTLTTTTGRLDFPANEMTGKELWSLLATPVPFLDMLVTAGLKTPEMCYPYGRGRFDPACGVPAICDFTLPMLTDEPDDMFDKLAMELAAWPRRAAVAQYRAFFEHLAGLLGRQVVVERSGGSLPVMGLLRRHFPDAKFVHMYRDGADCALSMSRFPPSRIMYLADTAARAAGLPPGLPPDAVRAALPEEFEGLLFPPIDAARLMAYPVPADYFGRWWSAMICAGLTELSSLPAHAWISLRYEDLVSGDPGPELIRLADFLGITATRQWLASARGLIVGGKTGTAAATLDSAALVALRQACEPGTRALSAFAARQPR